MASRRAHPDAVLVRALDDLAVHLVVPDARPVSAAVRALLADERTDIRRAGARPARARARVLVGVAAIVLVVASVLVVSSSTRDAVADLFGVRGVEIDRQQGPARVPVGSSLSLGARVTLDEARRRVDFDLVVPPRADLGTPDAVYVGAVPPGGRVTLAYAPRAGLPVTSTTGVGLLLTEFRAGIPDVVMRKRLAAGTGVEQVTVDGAPGFWISEEPHVLTLADEHGRFFEDHSRLAGNTLLWQRGDVTYRLESALSRDEAIAIAESVRPD